MTTPNKPIPDGSWTVGAFRRFQDQSPEDAKAAIRSGVIGAFTNAQNVHHREVRQPIQQRPTYDEVPTDIPLWVNLTSTDDTTFPLALLAREPDKNGVLNEAPFYQPSTGALELGMIRCLRDREYRQVGTIIGPAGWSLIHDAHLAVYTVDQTTGNLTLYWESGDIKAQLNAASTQYRFDIPPLHARQGDIYAVGFLANYFGLSGYQLATLPRWIINQPIGTQPDQPYYWTRGTDGGGNGPGWPTPPPFLNRAHIGTNQWWPWFLLG
ncbi:hypothetical protein IU500_17455 [Nocardia terpenica]|uniref:hypothetical protein n=1 Tax=Nocardia terpenica TaxID=455432 RepID=UPI001893DD07|nr:hypothetical protein [Nocardia terpenica]MBF6063272.1 hypothetical protein [Nocardia terpenica]MBF6105828.1 hypothetical protein [Nocardia terpenica]MBF6113588.1 hypothetical protein [Nocardia terpenica]MBF6119569.1 hypothetical protein [Nocardia terpenica]MBF6151980.1 hypothetical protein [Nocardia terpenica]